jgi:hypothetical protein
MSETPDLQQLRDNFDELRIFCELRSIQLTHNSVAAGYAQMGINALFSPNNQQLCPHSRILLCEMHLWILTLRGLAYPIHDIMSGKRTIRPSDAKQRMKENPLMNELIQRATIKISDIPLPCLQLCHKLVNTGVIDNTLLQSAVDALISLI